MSDKRKVKFNVGIADYRQGQIVNYADMPLGHRFWVDNDSILLDTKICDFIKEPKSEKETPDETEKTESKVDPEENEVTDKDLTDELKGFLKRTESESEPKAEPKSGPAFDPEPEKESEPALEPTAESEPGLAKESEPEPESKVEAGNGLSFDFDTGLQKPICPGKNKDRSPCKRDKLRPNGYCFQHQHQAPTGLTGEAPDNLKDLPGN